MANIFHALGHFGGESTCSTLKNESLRIIGHFSDNFHERLRKTDAICN